MHYCCAGGLDNFAGDLIDGGRQTERLQELLGVASETEDFGYVCLEQVAWLTV